MKKIVILMLVAYPTFAPGQDGPPSPSVVTDIIEDMEESERRFTERMRRTSIPLMSLNDLFEEESARELARAAGRGDVDEIDRLIADGVDVDSRGSHNATPLFWAFRNVDGFSRLLELGADPNVVYDDVDRTSVMQAAAEHRDIHFLSLLMDYGGNPNLRAGSDNEPPLFTAVRGNGNDKVTLLIDAGADLNAKGNHGNTPLLRAAVNGYFDSAYSLLERGADYSARNDHDRGLVDFIIDHRRLMNRNGQQWQWMIRVSDWLREHGVSVPD